MSHGMVFVLIEETRLLAFVGVGFPKEGMMIPKLATPVYDPSTMSILRVIRVAFGFHCFQPGSISIFPSFSPYSLPFVNLDHSQPAPLYCKCLNLRTVYVRYDFPVHSPNGFHELSCLSISPLVEVLVVLRG